MDRLACMQTFVRAVELGSISAAATDLDLSPQLAGKHVRLLEQSLGIKLLNRTTRRQSLTDSGRIFFERAKNILAEMDAAEALVAEARSVATFGAAGDACHERQRRPSAVSRQPRAATQVFSRNWIARINEKRLPTGKPLRYWCRLQDSNPPPDDYQSECVPDLCCASDPVATRVPHWGVADDFSGCCDCHKCWCRVSDSNRRPTAYLTTTAFAANSLWSGLSLGHG